MGTAELPKNNQIHHVFKDEEAKQNKNTGQICLVDYQFSKLGVNITSKELKWKKETLEALQNSA